MSPTRLRCSFLFAGLLAASAAFAGGDIVKCVDQSGHVTLTDEPCAAGARSVDLVIAAEPQPAAAAPVAEVQHGPAIEHVTLAQLPPVHHDGFVKKPGSTRMLARDVATLKMALLNMQVMDHASASMRQQRLAGLN